MRSVTRTWPVALQAPPPTPSPALNEVRKRKHMTIGVVF